MTSENPIGADNQQERLDAYIAGYVDGEGTFHLAVQKNPWVRSSWQLVPEFHVSQNPERRQVRDLIVERLGCGSIRENHGGSKDRTLVLVVRKRSDLITKVIPFFIRQPLLSSKQDEFLVFASIVEAMDRGEHLTEAGFERLRDLALQMNGGAGTEEFTGKENPQRLHAEHPDLG